MANAMIEVSSYWYSPQALYERAEVALQCGAIMCHCVYAKHFLCPVSLTRVLLDQSLCTAQTLASSCT